MASIRSYGAGESGRQTIAQPVNRCGRACHCARSAGRGFPAYNSGANASTAKPVAADDSH